LPKIGKRGDGAVTTGDIYILGIITGIVFLYWLFKKTDSLRRSKIVKRAKRAEKEAIKILQREGYTIRAVQQSAAAYTEVDGKEQQNLVTADYLVSKHGKTFVVEVKTGKQTARVTASRIRRQMLEYFLIFRPHGIILLDMDHKKLKHVFFRTGKLPVLLRDKFGTYMLFIAIFLLGAISGIIYSYFR
jgi:Holliday junction resolvase-like predicted endonuclease